MTTPEKEMEFYDPAPLLSLEKARYRLRFTVRHPLRILDLAPLFRGRIGYILKNRFCPFPDSESSRCTGCTMVLNCLYVRLFAPLHKSHDPSDRGIGKKCGHMPRPYALDGMSQKGETILHPGDSGCINLTLLGREAVEYRRPVLEALCHAAATLCSFHLPASQRSPGCGNNLFEEFYLQSVSPGHGSGRKPLIYFKEDRNMKTGGAPLTDWIDCLSSPVLPGGTPKEVSLKVRLRTPCQLKRRGNGITFTLFMQAIVSRLRDLKRLYHPDNDMGMFPDAFYSITGDVTTSPHLMYEKHTWYSHHGKKQIYLGGLTGSIIFKGNLAPFVPMIAAGYFLGVGQKTVYGLGRFEIPGWSC